MKSVFSKVAENIIFAAVGVCLCILFINVVMRYLFSYALGWTEELASYLQILIVYIGCVIAVGANTQIKVSILADTFPSLRKYMDFISDTGAFIFSVCIVTFGFQFVIMQWNTGQKSVSLSIPMYLIYAMLPLGGLLMALQYGRKIINLILKKKPGE
jgi:TRAP-type C4-dicarboxylate transport system permease small subunit